jgi:hypothetical protein
MPSAAGTEQGGEDGLAIGWGVNSEGGASAVEDRGEVDESVGTRRP